MLEEQAWSPDVSPAIKSRVSFTLSYGAHHHLFVIRSHLSLSLSLSLSLPLFGKAENLIFFILAPRFYHSPLRLSVMISSSHALFV
jgi:hypothetical protein